MNILEHFVKRNFALIVVMKFFVKVFKIKTLSLEKCSFLNNNKHIQGFILFYFFNIFIYFNIGSLFLIGMFVNNKKKKNII